jgi:hypothetical protein
MKARVQFGPHARASLASCAAVLLPLFAAADSQLELRSSSSASSAAAHVTFRIVIPPVLSLEMPGDAVSAHGELTATVFSNGHTVALAAATRPSEAPRGTLLLNSAARKALAQNAACTPGSTRSAGPGPGRARLGGEPLAAALVCTACMP